MKLIQVQERRRRCEGGPPASNAKLEPAHYTAGMLTLALLALSLLPEGLAGPHAVGVRVLAERDPERQLDGVARPIQVALWYPASVTPATPLSYGENVALGASERTLATVTPEQAEAARSGYRRFLTSNGVPAAAVDRWLAAGMLARAEAPPTAGRFPLVLVAQGNGQAAPDLAVLAEPAPRTASWWRRARRRSAWARRWRRRRTCCRARASSRATWLSSRRASSSSRSWRTRRWPGSGIASARARRCWPRSRIREAPRSSASTAGSAPPPRKAASPRTARSTRARCACRCCTCTRTSTR